MRQLITRISLVYFFCIFCACTPVEQPYESDGPKGETKSVESQIHRDNGYPVTLSESGQSAKACSDAKMEAIYADINYSVGYTSLVKEFTDGKITLKELEKKKRKLEFEMAKKSVHARPICGKAEMGSLSVGTRVQVLSPPYQCGPTMFRVKVLTGNHLDKIGCIEQEYLPEVR